LGRHIVGGRGEIIHASSMRCTNINNIEYILGC
jgi:hypothetical protein